MALIQCDVKGLEWVAGTFLSKDKVAYKEILNGVDQHSDNQQKFNLPTRLIAKTFVFRLIYGGSAYSYANDPDFTEVGYNEKKWQGVIDEFYNKYEGWRNWHTSLVEEATTTGGVRIPTGRFYPFSPIRRGHDLVWPRTKILNYPVQGLGADLVCIGRVIFYNRWRKSGLEAIPITSVHDSIVIDSPKENIEAIVKMLLSSIEDIPQKFKYLFKVDFDLPLTAEIKVGPNLFQMEKY